jgi:ribosomal protein S6--L-glutamate ligase
MIITSNRELKARYHELRPGDIFVGRLAYKHLKQTVLIDFLERGIACYPSPLAQTLNGSKAAQALVLKKWMLPHTCAVTRRSELISAVGAYNKNSIGPVVTKEDQMHCGHGVRKWDSVDIAYNFMAMSGSSYPFVLQPFLEHFTDVRVIIVDDYLEAYVRHNPNNFRMNISAGGKNYPYQLEVEQQAFCRRVMARGSFPYAHLDLQITDDGRCYLCEIALEGGIKGAIITRQELDRKKQTLLKKMTTL